MSSNYTSTQSAWRDDDRDEDTVERSSGLRPSNSTSSARPRNRRLISTDDGGADAGAQLRERSPIPKAHPSQRLGVPQRSNGSARTNGRTPSPTPSSKSSASFGKGLWEGGLGFSGSWSTIQGVAQTLLGGEDNGSGLDKSGQSTARRRNKNSLVPAPALKEWGPNGMVNTNGKGKGRETAGDRERERMTRDVNTLRTASTLESHDGVNGGLPISSAKSKHKRKSSSDDVGTMAPPDEDGDALVYVHHVQPSDTLAGVILKYNVDPATFRKANRLWPNDAIQVRKVVLVPVEASAVRGKPCEAPRIDSPGVDLLAPTPQDEEPPNLAEDTDWANGILSPSISHRGQNKETPSQMGEEEQPWVHVRWVLLSSSPNAQPTEIARLPRRTLGYFPPRRRKSQGMLSPFATPRPSFDLSSASPASSPGISGVRGTPARRLSNLSSSISSTSQGYFPPLSNQHSDFITSAPSLTRPPSTTRPRANSRTQSRSGPQPGGPETWFLGPGGVGTFAANVRKPGPANDGLNKLVAKHLPKFAIGDLPSTSTVGAAGSGLIEEANIGWGFKAEMERLKDVALNSVDGSGVATPTAGAGGGIDVGAAAQAIEVWVRRLGARPSLQNLKGSSSRGRGEERMGDLIELLDGAGSDDGMGFEPTRREGSVGVRKRGGKTD